MDAFREESESRLYRHVAWKCPIQLWKLRTSLSRPLGVACGEQSGDLVAQGPGVGPQFFGLGLDGVAQRLEDFAFQALGPHNGDGQRRQARRADHVIGGPRRAGCRRR